MWMVVIGMNNGIFDNQVIREISLDPIPRRDERVPECDCACSDPVCEDPRGATATGLLSFLVSIMPIIMGLFLVLAAIWACWATMIFISDNFYDILYFLGFMISLALAFGD